MEKHRAGSHGVRARQQRRRWIGHSLPAKHCCKTPKEPREILRKCVERKKLARHTWFRQRCPTTDGNDNLLFAPTL